MNREQQEMALWREAYRDSRCFLAQERAAEADAAVAEFRKRYPAESAASPAVWYEEPPFPKDGSSHPCWVMGEKNVAIVYWARRYDEYQWSAECHGGIAYFLLGRRVCPITRPPEPTQ